MNKKRHALYVVLGAGLLLAAAAFLLLLEPGREARFEGHLGFLDAAGSEEPPDPLAGDPVGGLESAAEGALPSWAGEGRVRPSVAPERRASAPGDHGLAAFGLLQDREGAPLDLGLVRAFFPDRSREEVAPGAGGEWTLQGPQTAFLQLEASAPGFVAQRAGRHPFGARLDFRLAPEARLALTLVSARDPRAPLAGARVMLGDPLRLLDRTPRPVAADGKGAVLFEGLVPGFYDLAVLPLDHAPRVEPGLYLAPGENRLTLAVQGGYTCRLRVLSAQTRIALEGVVVRVRLRIAPGFRGAQLPLPAMELRTDANGWCTISCLPVGTAQVNLQKSNYAESSFSLTVAVTSGEETREQLLVPGARLAGRVVDPEGRPVAGAAVSRVAVAGQVVRTVGGSAATDAAGGFELVDQPPGQDVMLVGRKAGWALGLLRLARIGPGDRLENLEIRLPPGVPMAGRVLDEEGAPVAGARVTAVPRGGSNLGFETLAGANGCFRIEHLLPWTYQIRASASGFLEAEATVTVPRKPVPQVEAGDLTLLRVYEVQGIVVSPDGFAPRGSTVEAQERPTAEQLEAARQAREAARTARSERRPPAAPAPRPAPRLRVAVDPFGAFRLELPRGRWRLAARGPGLTMEGVEPVEIELPGDTFVRICAAASQEWLQGGLDARLLNGHTGKPVLQAEVQGAGGARTYLEDGWLRVRQLAPGPRTLVILAEGLRPHLLKDLEIPPGEVLQLGTLRLDPGARLRITLRGQGKPLPADRKPQLQVRDPEGRTPPRFLQPKALRPENGVYVYENLAPGRYQVLASAAGFQRATREVFLQEGGDQRIQLDLKPQPDRRPGQQRSGQRPGTPSGQRPGAGAEPSRPDPKSPPRTPGPSRPR